MKVFKNKKQRFIAVFLSLVFVMMLVPFTDVYADTLFCYAPTLSNYNLEFYDAIYNPNDNTSVKYEVTCSDSDAYFTIFKSTHYGNDKEYYDSQNQYVFLIWTKDTSAQIQYTATVYDSNGNIQSTEVSTDSMYIRDDCYNFKVGMFTFSFFPDDEGDIMSPKWYLDLDGYYNSHIDEKPLSDNNLAIDSALAIKLYMSDCEDDYKSFIINDSDSEGGIGNPIYDEDIGTLIISKSKMYEESNGEDVNDLYNLFSWKMKTNTGFSLSDNKYARTFIQVRVESKCVVYDDRRHTKLHKKFDNYGEKAMLINSHPVDSQPLKISYLTDIPNVLPKTHAEIHNPVFTGYNYTLYFRVVCTDDLAVIPSDTSEWHCGGWRALDCNADILVGQSDTTENGNFDDEDNWVKDEDDGNNSIESGSDSVHDTDDAKDDFNNSSSAADSSVNGAISTMQSLLDMIRHVPQIISTIFSFLPSWCLNIVGLAFVALVVLIIYKLVRG